MAKIQIRKRHGLLGRPRWNVVLIADNHKVLSTSESLRSEEAAETNVAAQRRAFEGPLEVERVEV
jgi:uncharacterized protein YegP (UPF0339 family)